MRRFNIGDRVIIRAGIRYPILDFKSGVIRTMHFASKCEPVRWGVDVDGFVNDESPDMLFYFNADELVLSVYPAEAKAALNRTFGNPFTIKKVIFNPPATIVLWADGTKTVVKAEHESYDPEKGLAMCISKRALGNQGNYYETFKKWLPANEDLNSLQSFIENLCDILRRSIN